MAMTFEDAVVKFIKMYWNQNDKFNQLGSVKDSKYKKDYFDKLSNDLVPGQDSETPPVEKKKGKK